MEFNSRIFFFANGDTVDLKKVNGIGTFKKENNGHIYIPVFYEKSFRPVKYVVGYSIGEMLPQQKDKIFKQYMELIYKWSNFLNNQNGY